MTKSDQDTIKSAIQNKIYLTGFAIFIMILTSLFISIRSFEFEIVFFSLSVASIIIGYIFFIIITKNLRLDRKQGKVKIKSQVVKDKTCKSIQVPGDSSTIDTLLINISNNLLLQKVKKINRYNAITDGGSFPISKEEYEHIKIGQTIMTRRGFYSNLFLGIEKNNYA